MLDPYQKPNLFGVNTPSIRQGVGEMFDLRRCADSLTIRERLRGVEDRTTTFFRHVLPTDSPILELSRSKIQRRQDDFHSLPITHAL